MKCTPHSAACACPSALDTSRNSADSSILLPTVCEKRGGRRVTVNVNNEREEKKKRRKASINICRIVSYQSADSCQTAKQHFLWMTNVTRHSPSITGIELRFSPLISLIRCHIGRISSKLCLEHTEYTRMKACPLVIDSRCIAGN